jgi:hypothetical protein
MAKTPTEIRSLARAHTESALNCLAGIMNKEGAPESARVAAANSLLDRGWGKSLQVIAGDEDGGAVKIELNDTEAARRIAFTLAKAVQPTTH